MCLLSFSSFVYLLFLTFLLSRAHHDYLLYFFCKQLISKRLFRENCVYYDGHYVKDLSLLNREITQTIIVDNSPMSYIFHPGNFCTLFIPSTCCSSLIQANLFKFLMYGYSYFLQRTPSTAHRSSTIQRTWNCGKLRTFWSASSRIRMCAKCASKSNFSPSYMFSLALQLGNMMYKCKLTLLC